MDKQRLNEILQSSLASTIAWLRGYCSSTTGAAVTTVQDRFGSQPHNSMIPGIP